MNTFRSRSKDSQSTSAPRKKSLFPKFEPFLKKGSSQSSPYEPSLNTHHSSARHDDTSSQEHGARFSQQVEKIKVGATHGIALTVTPRQEQAEEIAPQKDAITVIEAPAAEQSIYRRAVLLRSLKEQAILQQNQSMEALFTDLQGPMDEYDQTAMNKVIKTVGPYVSLAQDVVKLGACITSFEPATSTAISIIGLLASTCAVICQASAEAFDHFESVAKELEWLHRCEGQITGKPDASVQKALLDVYAALLDIFFKIHSIFIKVRENVKNEGQGNGTIYTKRRAVLVQMLLRSIGGDLGPMQKTFTTRCNTLRATLDIDTNQTAHDTYEIAKRIEQRLEQSSAVANLKQEFPELRAFLGENSVASKQQDGRRLDLKHREDAACAWIEKREEFVSWASGIACDAKVLHLRGSAGSGKSVTTAYVADNALLSSDPAAFPRIICKHFCRDDNQSNDGATIFRSLLAQVLAARPELSEFISTKLPDIETSFASDKSQQDAWKIFSDALGPLDDSTSTYFVVDGLDECKPESCDQLVGFFQSLCETTKSVRIFVSSRDYDLSVVLQEKYMRPTHQNRDRGRDVQIIRYQLATTSPKLRFSDALMDYTVDKIADKTDGIVIWSHMAIEYLRTKKANDKKTIDQCLKILPATMKEVYFKHFEAAMESFDIDRTLLSDCLEIMASALRPMTLKELTWAVWLKSLDTGERRAVTVEQFDMDLVVHLSGIDPLRAFLLLPDLNSGQDGKPLKFVHQSLKEAILQLNPAEWNRKELPDVRKLKEECIKRSNAMNQTMLDLCVDYLMRNDIKDTRNDARYLEDTELRAFDWFDFECTKKEERTIKPWTPKVDNSENGITKGKSRKKQSSLKADGNATVNRKPKKRSSASEAVNSGSGTALGTNDVDRAPLPEAQAQWTEQSPGENDIKVALAPNDDGEETGLAAFERRNPQLGEFYSYAACHWYAHLQQSDPSISIKLGDLLALSKSGTVRAENWIERARLEPSTDVRGLPQDILTLSVFYGGFVHFDRIMDAKHKAVARSARLKLNAEEDTEDVAETDPELKSLGFKSAADFEKALYDVTERAVMAHDAHVLSKLAEKGQLSTYASFFGMLSETYPRHATVDSVAKWDKIADILFENLVANMSSIMSSVDGDAGKQSKHSPCQNAQEMLFEVICRAAELGCLPMVKKVIAFHKERCPDKSSLPEGPMRPEASLKSESGTITPNEESREPTDFGPLGCAVWGGHTEIVLYLLTVEGIDRHLRYHRELGSNILHFLVARANFVDINIIKALVDRYPEAVNEVNPNTPIQDLVNNYASDNEKVTEVLKYLILEKGADLKGGAPDVKLLEAAAKYNKEITCECLISGGLDPREVIEISETGEATLKVRIGDKGDPALEKALAEKILKMSLGHSKTVPSK